MKYFYIVLATILFALSYLYFKTDTKSSEVVDVLDKPDVQEYKPFSSFPENEEYARETNEYVKKLHEQNKRNKEVKNTYAYKKFREETLEILEDLKSEVKGNLPDVLFYGRVVDQNLEGVEGVSIRFYARNAWTSSGENQGVTKTDKFGNYIVSGIRGTELDIIFEDKFGYQFPEILNFSRDEWEIRGASNPYVSNAWKVDRYPKVIFGNKFVSFNPDDTVYTIDFKSVKDIKVGKGIAGDIKIMINRNNKEWNMEITAIDGGLQETNDEYRYFAPEFGYVKTLNFGGDKTKKVIYKNIYFNTRGGSTYGTVALEIWPFFNSYISAIDFDYVTNIENTRNLTIKK